MAFNPPSWSKSSQTLNEIPNLDDIKESPQGDTKVKRQVHDISKYSVLELLELKDLIEQRLPARSLKDMNLAEELIYQFLKTRELQSEVLFDMNIEANKQAAVVTACNSSLQHLVKLQSDLHNAERFKALEGMMIEAMKKLPVEVATAFLEEYEGMDD